MPSEQAMKAAREIAKGGAWNKRAEVAEIIDAAFAPVWLDKPDGAGWWWELDRTGRSNPVLREFERRYDRLMIRHDGLRGIDWESALATCIYCRATPPAPPKAKGEG